MTQTAASTAYAGVDEPGLMARIVRLQLVVSEQLDAVAARHHIAFSDYLVLGVIRRSPRGRCAPSTVCEVLHRTSGGMTLTLDRLEQSGWIERTRDADDRRKVVLRLTSSGAALAKAVNASLHEWESSIDASSRRKTALVTALDELIDALDS